VLRSAVAFVPKDPIFFAGTVRQNLDPLGSYCDHGSDATLWATLEAVSLGKRSQGLWQSGLDAQVEPNGGSGEHLNAYERQLVCVARAALRQPRVVVLEEASAGASPSFHSAENSSLLRAMRSPAFGGCTVLAATRHPGVLLDAADQVVVLENGLVVESGSPTDLLVNSQSRLFAIRNAPASSSPANEEAQKART
jgi:ABC-type multidrug transport system fused ATPase/permease subunit